MARIEAGELGDKGREREWLARAVRAPADRAWIADGYISDRWLPVSPVTGAVDAFEWKAPVDAIGRGDTTLLIEERFVPSGGALQAHPDRHRGGTGSPRRPSALGPRPRQGADPTAARPTIFEPLHAPDDPGVAQAEADESPTSLERLRAAQIR